MRTVHSWADHAMLSSDAPLPLDRPFTGREATSWGVPSQLLTRLVGSGHVRRLLRGVYVAGQVPDSLRLRVAALKLVVPEHGIVVDTTAGWLHGVDTLPRSAIHELPRLDVYSRKESRMRRGGVRSGIRELRPTDVEVVDGLQVTTMHRTALDVGRLLWRYDAIGALDGFLRAGVPHADLLADLDRFKGYRGVRQLRMLVPLATPLAESNPESALRLLWVESELPSPEPQWWVHDDDGRPIYRIDVADPEVRYGAEYFGMAFHDEATAEADARRLAWLDRQRGWEMDVFRKDDVYSSEAAPHGALRAGWERARVRSSYASPCVIDLSR